MLNTTYPIFIDCNTMADNSEQVEILRRFAEAAAEAQRTLDPLAQGSKDLHEKARARYAELEKDMKLLGSSVKSASKAMIDANTGSGKYASSIETATGAIGSFAGQFGILGKAIGGVITIFGKLAGGALKQNEALVKTYDTLAAFGDLDNRNFDQLGKDVRRAGFSMDQNADKFASVVKTVAPELINFGGSVSEGRKKLVDVFQNTLGRTEIQLERMGITSEEAFAKTGNYIKQLAISNGVKGKSDAELNMMSVRYMETLTGLSMITGQTRDEAEKRMQEQQNDLRFQMHLSKLRAAGQDEEADNLIATMAVMPKEMADGAKSLIVNQGRIVDEMGAKTYQLLGNEGIGQIVTAAKSKAADLPMALADMMNKHSVIIDKRFNQLGNNINFGNDTMNDFNMNIDSFNYKNRGANISAEQINEQLANIRKEGANDEKDANSLRKKNERVLRNAFEELEYQVSKIMIPAMNSFVSGMTKVGSAIADFLYWITKFIPGMKTIDIRDTFVQFNNLNDVSRELYKRNKEEQKLQDELNELKKTDIENEKYIAEQEELKRQGKKYNAKGLETGYSYRKQHEERISNVQQQLGNVQARSETARAQGANMYGAVAQAPTEKGTASIEGLTVKKGDVHVEGSQLDPKIVEMAKKVQAEMPGFKYFSSFNDRFHQDRNSQHKKGKAFDFVLDHFPTREEGKKIVEQLKAMGADHVIDEYNNPSSGATSGHIHAQLQGKTGGIFKGPESGYQLTAHGEEFVAPVDMIKDMVTKTQLPTYGTGGSGMDSSMVDIFVSLAEKLDDLLELQRKSNSTQDEILTYTKA